MNDRLSEAIALAADRYGCHRISASLDIAVTAVAQGASPEDAYRAASIVIQQLPTDEKATEGSDTVEDFFTVLREWIDFLAVLRDRFELIY